MNIKKCKLSKINNHLVIGSFDGIHLGHLKLLTKVDNPTVLLIYNIPSKTKNLYSLKQRIKILKSLNIKKIILFDVASHNMTAQTFYNTYLQNRNIKSIIVGSNFKLGSDQKKISKLETDTKVVEIKIVNNISTSRIKNMILENNFTGANLLLINNFYLQSKIIKGKKNGRKLGYRTANFLLKKNWFINDGVYETRSYYRNKKFKSLTFVGTSKSIDSTKKYSIETHILNFNKNIYHRNLKVEFIKYLGPVKKYNSVNQLKLAIKNYVATIENN